jgi:hypothetical protein
MGEFSGRYVKNYKDEKDYVDLNVDICVKLKKENRAFKVEKYEHSYPHCWRTDKPVLYYPLDAWFIKTTALKDKMVELNKTINWKPKATGEGRFGNWLENLVDWNLSRSRFWGIPLPIWRTEGGAEEICIGSVDELATEIDKSIKNGFMKVNPLKGNDNKTEFDLHRPYVDEIFLVSLSGKKMMRELDLIDVWFDSGAMPYAQWHHPFAHQADFQAHFPADFICEGVDQTRGWFYSLLAIGVAVLDQPVYRHLVEAREQPAVRQRPLGDRRDRRAGLPFLGVAREKSIRVSQRVQKSAHDLGDLSRVEPLGHPHLALAHEIEPHGVGMVLVHVRDRALLAFDQILRARKVGHDVGRFQIGSAGEAGIEMPGNNAEPPEREIGEPGVKLGLRMAGKKAPAHRRLLRVVAREWPEGADEGEARMGGRIALPGRGHQHRGAAIRFQVGGVSGKPGDQD